MIEHDLNIALFELFDELNDEPLILEYKKIKGELLDNVELTKQISKYNELQNQLANITYQSFVDDINKKCLEITEMLDNDELYQKYISLEVEIEERLVYLSGLIFEDIVLVSNHKGCAGCASK